MCAGCELIADVLAISLLVSRVSMLQQTADCAGRRLKKIGVVNFSKNKWKPAVKKMYYLQMVSRAGLFPDLFKSEK